MKPQATNQLKSTLNFILIFLLFSLGCGPKSNETKSATTESDNTEIENIEPEIMTPKASANKVHVAFAGGGWRAHTGHAGWIISLLDGNKKLKDVFANVGTISSNSGGSWFNTMMAMSPKFVSDIEAEDAILGWGNNGQGWLGSQHELFKSNSSGCSIVADGPGYGLCVIENYLNSATNWANIVENMVYLDYSLDDKPLTGHRQPWAEDKNLLLAASFLKSNVVLNSYGRAYTEQFYQACKLPSEPEFHDIPDDGALCSGSNPYYEVAPVTFSGMANNSISNPPFFSSLQANEKYKLLYSEPVLDPTEKPATIPNTNNNDDVPAVYAAAASSAALGFEAYVRENIWDVAYNSRNLAPAFSLKGDKVNFIESADELSAEELANQKIVRIADGGPVDNSGVAQLVAFLQQSNPTDSFNIIAFDNVTSSFPSSSGPSTKAKVGVDIANLFGKGICPHGQFCMFDCSDYVNFCVEIPHLQIFEIDPLLKTSDTWSINSGDLELIYTQYKVTTKDNSSYGISKGFSGTLHSFTCVAPSASTMPTNGGFAGYYEMLEFIHTALNAKNGIGLKHLEDAFGLKN